MKDDPVPLAESPALTRLLRGDRRAIAHSISALENDTPGADALAHALAPHLGRACVLGVTGAPGAGKSTLINAMLGELVGRGKRVAVVAVDPSSPVTGGAVLGDRVRMGEPGAHPNVFIRSVSSRGHLGGLSRTTARIVDVFDAAGYDVVIVETVGAGQSEVAITTLADVCIVVCPPGTGDAVQAIKAGILEIADVLVVNKGDVPAADATMRDLQDMLHLRRKERRPVPVLKTIATRGDGVAEVIDTALAHADRGGRGRRLATARGRAGEPGAGVDRVLEGAPDTAHVSARVLRLARRERFANALGVHCIDAGPGRATVAMTVDESHLNFNGTCHGGMIFTLADTAFGLASNSHGTIAAGIDAHIAFHVAARSGDRLTASAAEVSRSHKLAVYRVDVARDDGTLVASFTGTVYVTTRPNEPESDPIPVAPA